MTTRNQGDFGELCAMVWLQGMGYVVSIPFGHSPDYDLLVELRSGIARVQVKTSTSYRGNRWKVSLSTRGGNQSWNGITKLLDPARCDYLYAHVGDGRRWFIPTNFLRAYTALTVGGRRYAQFEVAPGPPIPAPTHSKVISRIDRPWGDARAVKGT